MAIMDTMQRTLQTTSTTPTVADSKEAVGWPNEFRRPVDAALHQSTPPPQTSSAAPRFYSQIFFG